MAEGATLRRDVARANPEELQERIKGRTAVVGIVGLGYVGLPLAAALGEAGLRCLGVDLDQGKCEALAAGQSYVSDVRADVVQRLVAEDRLSASTDYSALSEADVIVICVPTPVYRDKRPDLTCVRQAGEAVAGVLRPGQLVILESTCYPGTTEDLLKPILEDRSGLQAGRDFWLAFSPERIDPGNEKFGLTNTPKVVGGIGPTSTELAAALYSAVVPEVVTVSSPREAEMTKLIENTFRHVNIALANELAIVSERLGIDFWEALQAASSKPFGFVPFYPGPGVGGHCIPVDPHYLTWKARECEMPLRLIETAEQINAAMPHYVVERVVDKVNDRGLSMRGARVLILGVSYKRGIGDVRESPALKIIEQLESKGAVVSYHDPYVPELRCNGRTLSSLPLTERVLASQTCVVLVTDHDYDLELLLRASPFLIDTRNAIKRDTANCLRLWGKNGHTEAFTTDAASGKYAGSARQNAHQESLFADSQPIQGEAESGLELEPRAVGEGQA